MQFTDVVGQSDLKKKISGMIHSGKFPHAIMLAGPTGNGALSLALATAQFIQCENRQESDSCGTCPSCLKSRKFIHPDIYFTYPVIKPEKKKDPPVSADYIKEWRLAVAENAYLNYNDWMQAIGAENKQGNITADECRQIIHHLSLKTFESGYKVQIIWLAEHLGNEGNILLKLIEEPPAATVFILIAENMEMMLNTIISRTQVIKVNPIEDEALQQKLLATFEMTNDDARKITRISDGNYDTALTIATGEKNLNDKLLHQWLISCFNLKLKPSTSNTQNLVEWIEEITKIGRENQKIFLRYALFFFRECAVLTASGVTEKLDGEELKFAKGLSARLNAEQLEELSEQINKLHYYIERNANPKILFMSHSFKIAEVFKNSNVAKQAV